MDMRGFGLRSRLRDRYFGFEGWVDVFYVYFVGLDCRDHLLEVVLVADVGVQGYLDGVVVALVRRLGWVVGGAVEVDGRAVEFAYEFHLMAVVEFAEVAVFDGVGEFGGEQEEFGVLCGEVEDSEQFEGFDAHEADVEVEAGGDDDFVVGGLDDLFNFAGVVGEVMDQDLLVVVQRRHRQPPNLHLTIQQPRNRILIMTAKQRRRNRILLLRQPHNPTPQGKPSERKEVNILGGPHIQQILLDQISIPLVPLQRVLTPHNDVTFPLDMEFHAGQKFGAFYVGQDVYLHHLHLLRAHQQQHREGFDEFEPDDVLRLPVMEQSDLFELIGEYVDFVVVGENEQDVVGGRVGAVYDIFELPLDGGVVEVEFVLVVGHEGGDADDRGLLYCFAVEGWVHVHCTFHFIIFITRHPQTINQGLSAGVSTTGCGFGVGWLGIGLGYDLADLCLCVAIIIIILQPIFAPNAHLLFLQTHILTINPQSSKPHSQKLNHHQQIHIIPRLLNLNLYQI